MWVRASARGAALGLLAALLAGCSSGAPAAPFQPPSPVATATQAVAPPAEVYSSAAEAAPALILAERRAASSGDLAALAALWADDAQVVETRNTADTGDDYRWSGRRAVLDRYVVAVFPSPPPPLEALTAAAPSVEGDRATLVNGVDHWTFIRRDGRWWIEGLGIGE